MAAAAITLEGAKEFRSALKAIEGETKWASELAKAHKQVGQFTARYSAEYARGTGGSTAHFADYVTGRGTAAAARVGVRSPAGAAFWGAKRRTGWNAKNVDSRPQHPAWVGNSWEPGGAGGPYGINPAIRFHLPEILDEYLKVVDDVSRRAFPE
jgi:hypothetical protein